MAIETSRIGRNKRIDVAAITRLDLSGLQKRVVEIGLLVQNEWRRLARGSLRTTATDYVNNIQLEYNFRNSVKTPGGGGAKAEVVLHGTVPNMVEQGLGPGGVGSYGAFDMRIFILKGREFVDVPFDRTSAEILKYGYSNKPFSFKRGDKEVVGVGAEEYAKTLLPGERMKAGMAPVARTAPNFIHDPMTGKIFAQEPHATDPFAGMIKHTATYAKTTGHTFTAFRRLSADGKPWMHPGIRPRNFAQKIDYVKCINIAFSLAV